MKKKFAVLSVLASLATAAVCVLVFLKPFQDNPAGESASGADPAPEGRESPSVGSDAKQAPVAEKEPDQEAPQDGAEKEEPAHAAEAPSVPDAAADSSGTDAQSGGDEAVETFDALVDGWMDPAPGGISIDDMEKFAKAFSRLPEERKDEEIHRALNLLPDENVFLLAAILFDKKQSAEIVDTVFSDILNRPEEVKNPILDKILLDRNHPCWATAAWIRDATD